MRRALVDMWLGSERRQPKQDVDRAEDRDDALCRLVREGLNGLVSEALDQAGRDPAVAVLHLLLKHVHARQQVTYSVRIADALLRVQHLAQLAQLVHQRRAVLDLDGEGDVAPVAS